MVSKGAIFERKAYRKLVEWKERSRGSTAPRVEGDVVRLPLYMAGLL